MVSVTEVDRAWKQGYEAGRAEKPWHKLTSGRSTVEVVVAVLVVLWAWKDRRAIRQWGLVLIPWCVALFLCLLPWILIAVMVDVGRRQYLRHRRRRSRAPREIFEPVPEEPPIGPSAAQEEDYRVLSTNKKSHTETRRYPDGRISIIDTRTGKAVEESDFWLGSLRDRLEGRQDSYAARPRAR